MIMMRAGWKKLVVIIILPGHDPAFADYSCHHYNDCTGAQAKERPEAWYQLFSPSVRMTGVNGQAPDYYEGDTSIAAIFNRL